MTTALQAQPVAITRAQRARTFALRVLAGLSLLGVLVAGVVASQWVLPVEVQRTVDESFGKGMENLEIDAGPGVRLKVINRDRAARRAGYRATSTGTLSWPAPVYNPDTWVLSAGCPEVAAERCRIDLDVYVPGRLIVYIYPTPHTGTIVIDSDVDAHIER